MEVKALACELPATSGVPLSRWSTADIARYVRSTGLVATMSDKTVWRWLHEDAIRPWQHRTWIFPRDPQFAIKAGRILDLYERQWAGKPLKSDDFVISADEKTSIQARHRCHRTLPALPDSPVKVEISTSVVGRGPISPPWMCIARNSLAVVSKKTGMAPSRQLLFQVK
jgi:hypothetical protein